MLAQIRNSTFPHAVRGALLSAATLAIVACASKEKPPLIADDAAQRESAIPWNEQQDWENKGQFGGMSDRMEGR